MFDDFLDTLKIFSNFDQQKLNFFTLLNFISTIFFFKIDSKKIHKIEWIFITIKFFNLNIFDMICFFFRNFFKIAKMLLNEILLYLMLFVYEFVWIQHQFYVMFQVYNISISIVNIEQKFFSFDFRTFKHSNTWIFQNIFLWSIRRNYFFYNVFVRSYLFIFEIWHDNIVIYDIVTIFIWQHILLDVKCLTFWQRHRILLIILEIYVISCFINNIFVNYNIYYSSFFKFLT